MTKQLTAKQKFNALAKFDVIAELQQVKRIVAIV